MELPEGFELTEALRRTSVWRGQIGVWLSSPHPHLLGAGVTQSSLLFADTHSFWGSSSVVNFHHQGHPDLWLRPTPSAVHQG